MISCNYIDDLLSEDDVDGFNVSDNETIILDSDSDTSISTSTVIPG